MINTPEEKRAFAACLCTKHYYQIVQNEDPTVDRCPMCEKDVEIWELKEKCKNIAEELGRVLKGLKNLIKQV